MSSSDSSEHHSVSTGSKIIIPVLMMVAIFAIQQYELNLDDKKINDLRSELNKTNVITSQLLDVNKQQDQFNIQVQNWSNLVNNDIVNIYNKTGVHLP